MRLVDERAERAVLAALLGIAVLIVFAFVLLSPLESLRWWADKGEVEVRFRIKPGAAAGRVDVVLPNGARRLSMDRSMVRMTRTCGSPLISTHRSMGSNLLTLNNTGCSGVRASMDTTESLPPPTGTSGAASGSQVSGCCSLISAR